ncbi:SixA phosphatase family protein [Pseudooctadecabacter jejudonensis]|uniref:Phosphohistidine phosphatase n=1 Tax=Pseudooctadecabacter jejudonensis TaxID=1391910 RepID=A0A1Y5S1K8_9RHOB|nr:histidine phosphatase family protein [Pseudooctadecabacter jejudonensis]SLN27849.1 phosphohistidine phosphatase [Pseudooctadecabacter jejudonensis]
MTKRLILIRHAKSSWDSPSDDHARPLNDRGRKACKDLGHWLSGRGHVPDAVFCSDAARTVETTDRIVAAMDCTPDVTYLNRLYHATPETLMDVVKSANGSCAAIIAHNPGIAYFAEQIVTGSPEHPQFFNYPTGAILVCDLPITNWADATSASAQLIDFVVPKDLSGGG